MMRRRYPCPAIILAALLLAWSATPSMAAEPPKEPILRIETGMHTAMINRIGIDASNRWLVTSSEDKTVRVWSLPEGRLVGVIRPPVGEGNEGKLYAVAISPDGRTVTCGGWTVISVLPSAAGPVPAEAATET